MCDMGISTLVITGITTAMSMAGQYMAAEQQSDAAQAQANAQAQAALDQKSIAEQQAKNEINKGIVEQDRQRKQSEQVQGRAASMLAGSGFQMDSGSAMDLLIGNAEEAQFDSNIISKNAEMAAWGHLANATSAGNDASMYKSQAANADNNGMSTALNMGSSLLGGLGTMGAQYTRWNNSKPPKVTK